MSSFSVPLSGLNASNTALRPLSGTEKLDILIAPFIETSLTCTAGRVCIRVSCLLLSVVPIIFQ